MTTWRQYEQKRNALEKRWQKRILVVLNNQLKNYVTSLRNGQPNLDTFASSQLTETLSALYGDVGAYWARTTFRELRPEAVLLRTSRRNGTRSQPATGVSISNAILQKQSSQSDTYPGVDALRLKRGALGFSIEWASRIINRLRMAGLRLATFISETSRDRVLKILEEAQSENLTLDETAQRLIEQVGEINRRRALTIARTEVGRASGEGKMQGAKELGVELTKKWVSARDHRTRRNPNHDPGKGDHWVLNGQVKDFDEPFDNGVHKLMQPGDASAPPSETIACRCTVVFEVKKDMQGRAIERQYLTL